MFFLFIHVFINVLIVFNFKGMLIFEVWIKIMVHFSVSN